MALPTNCVGYWKLNESSGDASDTSGNGYTLTNTSSCTYAAGKLNNAGTTINTGNHRFVAGDICDLNAGAFTIALWIKTSNSTNYRGMISKGHDGGGGGNGWALFNHGTGCCIFRNVFTGAAILTSDVAINDGNWHHVVVTRSASGGHMKIWIDNTEDVSARADDTTDWANSYNFRVGTIADDLTINNAIDGSFDNVLVIVGTEWGSTEITADYNSGNGQEYAADVNYTATPSTLAMTFSLEEPQDVVIYAATFQMMTITLPAAAARFVNPLGTILVGTGGLDTKYINKDYPVTEGLTAGTTKQYG